MTGLRVRQRLWTLLWRAGRTETGATPGFILQPDAGPVAWAVKLFWIRVLKRSPPEEIHGEIPGRRGVRRAASRATMFRRQAVDVEPVR